MIRSDTELGEFQRKLIGHAKRLADYRAELEQRGLPDPDVQSALEPVRAFGDRLQGDVDAYERLKQGELPSFVGIEHLGETLVAARLAVRMSQRELASRLGVNESIISRDEKSAYHGITTERAAKLLKALGLSLECTVVRISSDEVHRG